MSAAVASTALFTGAASTKRAAGFSSSRSSVVVRAAFTDKDGIVGLIDKATKKHITTKDVERNQEQNVSEQLSVFGAKPSSEAPYPRKEMDRRPETGDRTFPSLMAFDGAGPETINGRLAMVGLVWAFVTERLTGQTVAQQLYAPGNFGLFNYLVVVQLIAYASLVPMFKGESPDSRQSGPFRAKAERWNGRTAMVGFLSLVLTEAFTHTAVFSKLPPMM